MNQAGNKLTRTKDKKYNWQPYFDYTGYEPKNSAFYLKNPSRWQPNNYTDGNGIFKIQKFVTPQMAETAPFSFKKVTSFNAPRPNKSDDKNWADYVKQAQEILDESANLDDQKKLFA